MSYILIGNVLGLIGALILVYTGLIKDKKQILFFQSIQILCYVFSNLVLKGYSGFIVNGVSFFRNIVAYKNKLTKTNKAIIIIITIALGIFFNNKGIIGYLPIINNTVYTIFMTTKDIKKFKVLLITILFFWGIYDLYIMAYTTALFDYLTLFANIYSLYVITKKKHTNIF